MVGNATLQRLLFAYLEVLVVAELAVGNIVRRVLHIIREEDVSLTSPALPGVSVESDDDESDTKSSYSAAAVAAANRSALRAPSLHNLLESIPDPVKAPEAPAASIADSESRSRCKFCSKPLCV
jgi:translation initiation factor eIF-2B subunit beta